MILGHRDSTDDHPIPFYEVKFVGLKQFVLVRTCIMEYMWPVFVLAHMFPKWSRRRKQKTAVIFVFLCVNEFVSVGLNECLSLFLLETYVYFHILGWRNKPLPDAYCFIRTLISFIRTLMSIMLCGDWRLAFEIAFCSTTCTLLTVVCRFFLPCRIFVWRHGRQKWETPSKVAW